MNDNNDEDLSLRIRLEAEEAMESEPELSPLLHQTVLHPRVKTFEDAVASTMVYRLLYGNASTASSPVDPTVLFELFQEAYQSLSSTTSNTTDAGDKYHSIANAIHEDVLAVIDRDPACDTILEVVLFFKGFAALACHRAAGYKWHHSTAKKSMLALWMQSQSSAVFGVDIHPAATIGAGVIFDHGTAIVIGETTVVGDGCTILQGVTLGGTGKESGRDRHPKIGKHVLVGAGAKILGNIVVGDAAKIGAGSIVLRAIPAGATAVGAPAKIIGRTVEKDPARTNETCLTTVAMLHKSLSTATVSTEASSDSEEGSPEDSSSSAGSSELLCPFREYTLLAEKAPPGTVTIVTLRKLLMPLGITSCAVGPIMFELDTRNVGYVCTKAFEQRGKEAIRKVTQLPSAQVEELCKTLLAEVRSQQAVVQ